ncbi:Histone-lysine N-methyltransferase, H3 lysine-79 specific [Aphelenchoides bicaudatus]|nr:Histone-lysine N-methyltransferase, H3 lysine-79 specific [Aphelenchoides bicaudatus]
MNGQKSTDIMHNGEGSNIEMASEVPCDQTNGIESKNSDIKELILFSPAGGQPISFIYSVPNTEFVDILRLAFEENDSLRTTVSNSLTFCLDELYNADFETLQSVCTAFNKAAPTISQLSKGMTTPGVNADLASPKFLQRIITHCYNKAVENERALNKHYEPFSSCTYGETSFERMQMIIDEINPKGHDVFVDLGSGVGQLVAHMAGGSKVKKAFGIEISELPAKFAARLEEEFRKLMRFYGKKTRCFSLDRGDFLDRKYRDLIIKEATIIFINNFAFNPDLESRIKYELLVELQSGTKVISTKPYAPLKGHITDRQLYDFASMVDITELRRCSNPCSWTANDVPYYLHVVDHGKIEKYITNKKPNSLRAPESRRSSPSSSKNSNSRESSVVNYRDASGKHATYGPTTRNSWKLQLSSERSSMSRSNAVSSDSDASEPEKKRKRKGKQTKERKTRKPKNAKVDMDLIGNDMKLSEDAQEGIELMHKMTQAVSAGHSNPNPMDSIKTALLADLTSNDVAPSSKKRTSLNGCKQTDAMFPLTDALPPSKRKKRATNQIQCDTSIPNSKYVHLDVFLCKLLLYFVPPFNETFPAELRRTYEEFLDKIHTPPNASAKEKLINELKQGAASTSNISAIDNILQMVDRINQKQNDLAQDISSLRRAVVSLHSSIPIHIEGVAPQQAQNSTLPNNLPINGIHQTQSANTSNSIETNQQMINDTVSRYASLLQNGTTAVPNVNQHQSSVMKTYLNLLATNYSPNVSTANTATINSTLLGIQNPQHLSPQQPASFNQYGTQLSLNSNGTAINGSAANLAASLNQRSLAQWTNDIVPQLNAFLSSNDYTALEKSQILQQVAKQNPMFSAVLQAINDPSLATQLQNSANSISFNSPTNSTAQPDVFSHTEATTSNAASNPLLLAQKPMTYTPQTPISLDNSISTNQLAQAYTATPQANNDELPKQKSSKKTERKPRSNPKKPKEAANNGVSLPSNLSEASGSEPNYTNAFTNSIGKMPLGVEKILSQQLSIQQSLNNVSKDAPFLHSPSF